MNIKKAFLALIFVFLAAVTLFQTTAVKAQTASPLTAPSPTPTPSPITSFTYIIRGNITFRIYNIITRQPVGSPTPAANVTVKAINKDTREVFQTSTDSSGNYSLNLKIATYGVMPSDNQNTHFNPQFQVIDLQSDKVANFTGIIPQ